MLSSIGPAAVPTYRQQPSAPKHFSHLKHLKLKESYWAFNSHLRVLARPRSRLALVWLKGFCFNSGICFSVWTSRSWLCKLPALPPQCGLCQQKCQFGKVLARFEVQTKWESLNRVLRFNWDWDWFFFLSSVPYNVRVLSQRNEEESVHEDHLAGLLPTDLRFTWKFRTIKVAAACQCAL